MKIISLDDRRRKKQLRTSNLEKALHLYDQGHSVPYVVHTLGIPERYAVGIKERYDRGFYQKWL